MLAAGLTYALQATDTQYTCIDGGECRHSYVYVSTIYILPPIQEYVRRCCRNFSSDTAPPRAFDFDHPSSLAFPRSTRPLFYSIVAHSSCSSTHHYRRGDRTFSAFMCAFAYNNKLTHSPTTSIQSFFIVVKGWGPAAIDNNSRTQGIWLAAARREVLTLVFVVVARRKSSLGRRRLSSSCGRQDNNSFHSRHR